MTPDKLSRHLLEIENNLDRLRYRTKAFAALAEASCEPALKMPIYQSGEDLLLFVEEVAGLVDYARSQTGSPDNHRRHRVIKACRMLDRLMPGIDVNDNEAVIAWAHEVGVSVDWLMLGEERPMLA